MNKKIWTHSGTLLAILVTGVVSVAVLTAIGLLIALTAPAVAGGKDQDQEQKVLAKLRRATAEYHQVGNVIEDGYQLGYIEPFLLDHCIAHPTDGAMGYHYFNHGKIHDTELDPYQPEGIVFAPKQNGKLQLAALEWIVPQNLWEAENNTEPPKVHGRELHILNPALGWYILHAWVWLDNPSGTWMDWNPRVDCS